MLSALAKVDEVYQAAVALFYLEDCSYKDIAAILEVPIGTVKSRIARGIGQLREILLSDGSATERDYHGPGLKFHSPPGTVRRCTNHKSVTVAFECAGTL